MTYHLLERDGAYIICANGKMILSFASKHLAKATMRAAVRLLVRDGTALALHFDVARREAHCEIAASSETELNATTLPMRADGQTSLIGTVPGFDAAI